MSTEPMSPARPGGGAVEEAGAAAPWLLRLFGFVVARRWPLLVLYALLLPPAVYFAVRVHSDNSIDRLIAADDPERVELRAFQKVFGAGEYAVLIFEADDPFAPGVLQRLDRIERGLAGLPRVQMSSALSMFRRAKADFAVTPEQCRAFRDFARGTALLRRQGLVGDDFLAVALVLDVQGYAEQGYAERRQALDAVERVIAAAGGSGPPLRAVRRVGLPYVNVKLHDDTKRDAPLYFVLFGAFVVALTLGLYRSFRALLAFLLTLAACVALAMGYVGLTGGVLTIVSPMVPMTILVTATASLVYLHSRFVACPAGRPVEEHRTFALANQFVACTASIFATAVGFAALTVSRIHPIWEMGIWVAVGLFITWIVVFTLYPALQRVLRAPTQQERRVAAPWFALVVGWLIGASWRWRWPLVAGSVLLAACGAVALFGLPGYVPHMRVLTNPVEYINESSTLYADTRRAEQVMPGLAISEVWLKGGLGSVSEPAVLTGLDRFQQALEADPDVGAAVGPTTILRLVRYLGGRGDAWPTDADAMEEAAADLEGLVAIEPLLQRFVQKHSLAQTHVSVVSHAVDHEGFERLAATVRRLWSKTAAEHPALSGFELKLVGLAPLQARVSQSLVPTLVESFELTVLVIFCTFLLVFRSGAARLLAMIPSLFAILVMFGAMRVFGMTLNVATILIASTVLGTSENDQIHFFYHYQEKKRLGASVEQALRHTFTVSGRAIFFATLINAGGFLAFALADLPPFRQFGLLTALAFLLSMVADFTALPAALWLVFRDRPDAPRS
ncbi:MAG: MMPL family transporter [Deltaproteobacteria bacterium]|nr:MMPL family transporter [Deltaproteobacteria bacterium]